MVTTVAPVSEGAGSYPIPKKDYGKLFKLHERLNEKSKDPPPQTIIT